jgi:peptidoglycan/LPS O-acetylase OafA/YrhL
VLAFHTEIFTFPLAGPLAVWSFFFISGYLVSRILYEQYRGRPQHFLINRFLRLFPTYWAALLIGICLFVAERNNVLVGNQFELPDDFAEWHGNVFILGLPESPRIISVAWSLAVELKWYLILFIGSFLPERWVRIFLIITVLLSAMRLFIWHETIYINGAGFAFSMGALAYHTDFRAPKYVQRIAVVMLPIMVLVVPLCFGLSARDMRSFPVNLALMGVVVLMYLSRPWLTTETTPSRFSVLAGELSYPVFLTHQFAGWIAMLWFHTAWRGWSKLAVTTVVCLVMSFIVVRLVEHPIAIVRARIRAGSVTSLVEEIVASKPVAE